MVFLVGTEVYLFLAIINVFQAGKLKAGLYLVLINLIYLFLLITVFLGLAVILYLNR